MLCAHARTHCTCRALVSTDLGNELRWLVSASAPAECEGHSGPWGSFYVVGIEGTGAATDDEAPTAESRGSGCVDCADRVLPASGGCALRFSGARDRSELRLEELDPLKPTPFGDMIDAFTLVTSCQEHKFSCCNVFV